MIQTPMFSLLFRRNLISNVRVYDSTQTFLTRLFSSNNLTSPKTKCDETEQSFTVSYLINSCGLSFESAISASKKVHLKSPEKPDLLLALFKNHGFNDAHISRMVSKIPRILKADPKKTILPKLEFFDSIGVPPHALANVVSTGPCILMYSLQNSIIPAFNNLRVLCGTNEKIVHFFKRTGLNYHFIHYVLNYTLPNVELLRKYGVSEPNISFLISNYPQTLVMTSDRLSKLVDRVVELGVDTNKIVFAHAIRVIVSISNSNWEHKKEVYRRWGWSDSDISMAFSVNPMSMNLSEEKITSMMEFLVNEMRFQPPDIAKCAVVLGYNLEKRIKPRCRVAKVLKSRGLMDFNLHTLLVQTNEVFLERYVSKYQENINIPLLDIYRGKLCLEDLEEQSESQEL